MAINLACPRCDREYSVGDAMAGRRVTCQACGQEFGVPAAPKSLPSLLVVDDSPPPPPVPRRNPIPTNPIRHDDEFQAHPPPRRVKPRRERAEFSSRSAASDPNLGTIIGSYFILNVACLLIGFVLVMTRQVDPFAAGRYYAILFVVSSLAMIAGGSIGVIMVAFHEGPEQGLLCLFPPYQIIYLFRSYEEAKKPFAILLTGVIGAATPFLILFALASGATVGATPRAREAVAINHEALAALKDMNNQLDQIHDMDSARLAGPVMEDCQRRARDCSDRLRALGLFNPAERAYIEKIAAAEVRPVYSKIIANARRLQAKGLGQGQLAVAIAKMESELAALGPPSETDEPIWQNGGGVVVYVENVTQQADQEIITERLKKIANPDGLLELNVMVNDTEKPGQKRFQIEPVNVASEFAEKIDFGKVTKRVEWRIYVTPKLSSVELEARRKIIADRKAEDLAKAAEREKERQAKAEIDRKRDEFLAVEAKKRRDEEAKSNMAPPLEIAVDPNAGPIDKALVDTRSSDATMVKDALERLSWGVPQERKAEVARAVVPILSLPNYFTAKEAAKALGALKSPEAVPALIAALERKDLARDIVMALGEIGDQQAAEALADRLEKNWPEANKALITIGPAAESAVLPKLKDRESRVRTLALEVLEVIGGPETLKTMKAMRPDSDFGVRVRATQTFQAISQRVKK